MEEERRALSRRRGGPGRLMERGGVGVNSVEAERTRKWRRARTQVVCRGFGGDGSADRHTFFFIDTIVVPVLTDGGLMVTIEAHLD